MRRWVAFLLAALFIAYTASAVPYGDRYGTDRASTVRLASFGLVDAASLTSGNCALLPPNHTGADQSCGAGVRVPMPRDFVITSVSVAVMATPWTLTDSCDVLVRIDTVDQLDTEFEVGGIVANLAPFELDATGDAATISGLKVTGNAGDFLDVEISTPTDTTRCNTPPCVCTTAVGSFYYDVYGEYL